MNAVASNPVTNLDFTRALARAVHRSALLPVPRAALRIALGEFSDILLASQRVLPRVAEDSGYIFVHSDLGRAIDDVTTSMARLSAA
jgi:NAD dependent epimerase/dehydratase family enzyme